MSDVKWYVINTVVGYENKIAQLIQEEVKKHQMESLVEQVIVPIEKVNKNYRGKKVGTERKMMPGYVLVKLDLTDELWNLIKNIKYSSRCLGNMQKPSEVPQSEIDSVLSRIEEVKETAQNLDIFEIGELIKLKEGPFEGFSAIIEGVYSDKNRLEVLVSILGNETSLDLPYEHAEKINKE